MSRRLLTHYLLLFAVVFHTVVGMPLHEATHMVGGHDHAHAHADGDSAHDENDHGQHGHDEDTLAASAESACTWCQSLGQLGLAITPATRDLPSATGHGHWLALAQAHPFGPPDHWRYTARAPPPRNA